MTADSEYERLLGRISDIYTTGRVRAHQAVNAHVGLPHGEPMNDRYELLLFPSVSAAGDQSQTRNK